MLPACPLVVLADPDAGVPEPLSCAPDPEVIEEAADPVTHIDGWVEEAVRVDADTCVEGLTDLRGEVCRLYEISRL